MDKTCCMIKCNDTNNFTGRQFYQFPSDSNLCKKWVESCEDPQLLEEFNCDGVESLSAKTVCSWHFNLHDFIDPQFKRLKTNAIPKFSQCNFIKAESDDYTRVSYALIKKEGIVEHDCSTNINGICNKNEVIVKDNSTKLNDDIYANGDRNTEVHSAVLVQGNDIKQILENQNKILDQQSKIFDELAKQRTTLEFLCEIYNNSTTTEAVPSVMSKDVGTINILPVDTTEKLQELELFLLNEDNMNKLVEKMSSICGTTGKMNGINCCYTLVDSFFNREFLTKFSWAGGSRDVEGKIPFKINKNLIKTFYKVVALADYQFSETDCQTFFKSVVKNAKRRAELMSSCVEQKRSSAGKRRPHNLIYQKS